MKKEKDPLVLDGTKGLHLLNPVAGIFAKLHAGSKTFVFVKESTQTILVEPTKVLRNEIWGPPFKVKIGLVPFA